MRSVEFVEYSLRLSTDEDILVSELDPASVPCLWDNEVLTLAAPFLAICTRAPRAAVEDAKSGLPESLEPFLGTPPAGCLLKAPSPVCAELRFCAISDRTKCSTAYFVRKKPAFPLCWTADLLKARTPEKGSQARDLVDSIVSAWRDGRHVVLVY